MFSGFSAVSGNNVPPLVLVLFSFLNFICTNCVNELIAFYSVFNPLSTLPPFIRTDSLYIKENCPFYMCSDAVPII